MSTAAALPIDDELDARVERKSSKKEVQVDWYERIKRKEIVWASLFLR